MGNRIGPLAGTLLVIAFGIEPVGAAIRCVPLSHPGSCDQRYATIQEAVDASAASGDSIFVAAGTYTEQVTAQGKSLSLFGARAGKDARGRVGSETVVTHPMGALVGCGNALVIDGFTFSGATDISGNWTAVWIDGTPCVAGGTVTFRNNIVRDSIWGMSVNGAPVVIERNWFVANNAVPQYSLGLQMNATSDDRIERNRFEAHAGSSLELSGTTRMSVLRNEFDGRVRLLATTDSTIEGNASASAAAGAVLFELAGGVDRTAFLSNTMSVATGKAVWLAPDSTADPNTQITLHNNCIRGPGAVGLEVAAGSHEGPLDAVSNWWGAASGPSGAGPGTGAAIVDPGGVVSFAPFSSSSSGCPCAELPNGSVCDDGDLCTATDQCLSGTCRSGATPSCEDANDCTVDSCDPQSGACVHSSSHCTDGDPCTVDTCNASGQCAHSASTCDDGNPCTSDVCDGAGGCTHPPVPGSCDDGNPCTLNDTCDDSGICRPGSPVCTDSDPCTDNVCDPATLACSFPPRDCSDGNRCTTDTCLPANGTCVHTPACDDGNLCTNDACDAQTGQCSHFIDDTNSCNDGNPCTTGDHCASGVCVFGPPLNCNDGNVCTEDGCGPPGGCWHQYIDGPCTDGNACTVGDYCEFICHSGPPLDCNDGNACTDDSCNPSTGQCSNVNDDTNPCMTGGACGTCSAGTCLPTPPNCDDGVDCTLDGCNANGCFHNPVHSRCGPDPDPQDCTHPACLFSGCGVENNSENTPCAENCGAGRCFGGVCSIFVPCSIWDCNVCNTQTHQCTAMNCDDGNPCTQDYCSSGFCEHIAPQCNDNDPCTTDFCNAAGQCDHTSTGCDDGNPCTDDTCVPGGGCTNVADDSNTCLPGTGPCAPGACSNGSCVGQPAGGAAEIAGVRFPFGKNTIGWSPAMSGSGLEYQVLRGMLADLPVGTVPLDEVCVAQTTFTSVNVVDDPSLGSAYWYLVRSAYAQCDGTYGFQGDHGAAGAPRISSTCP